MTAKPDVEKTAPDKNAAVQYRLLRIARDQFDKQLSALSGEEQQRARSIAAHEILLEQAVLASTEASEVVIPQSQAEQAYEQIKARYDDEVEFEQEMAAYDLDPMDVQEALHRALRVESILDYIGSRAPEPDATDVELYHYMNQDKFYLPEIRTARQILITVNDDFSENHRQAALDKIKQILNRVQKKPSRFSEQAMKHSECPTALQGGLLGQVKPDTLYPELDAALFALPEGGISDIIETELGFHILFCEAVRVEGTVPLAEVRDTLTEQLRERQRSLYVRRWIQSQLKARQDSQQTIS